jgi:hypothetical protein
MYKKMYNQVTIGGPEETLGTAIARTARFPVKELALAVLDPDKKSDEVITGRGAVKKYYIHGVDVSASISAHLEACKAIGMGFTSLMGQDLTTPSQVGGAAVITYTGASDSCKVVVSDTGQTISTLIGDLGDEVADTNFDTDGEIDLTASATDTLSELVSVIDGFTGYKCEKLFGPDSCSTTSPLAITSAQASGRSVVIYFTSAASGVYLHRFTPVLTNTERPGYSFQFDNTGTAYDVIDGGVVDTASISAELKSTASVTMNVKGLEVTNAESASSVALSSSHPLKFSDSAFFLNGSEMTYVRSFSTDISNNHNADEGHGTGSLYKQDHAKGEFAVTGSLTVRTDSTSETERAKRLNDTTSSLLVKLEGQDIVTSIPEMVIVRLAAMQVMNASKSEGGISIDTSFDYNVIDENSYDDMITIDMLTTDDADYGYIEES